MTDASQDTAVSEETPVEATETVEETTQAETQETATDQPTEASANDSESGEDSAEKETEEREKRRNSFQERINQKTREAKEAQARVAELEQRLQAFEQSQEGQDLPPRPKLEDFEYDESRYYEALDDWTEQRSLLSARKARMQEQREEAQAQQQRIQQLAQDTFRERSAEFQADHPDYREKLKALPNSPVLMQAALLSEQGPQLAYYLGSNPDIANQLAGANPLVAAMELGKIQAKLASPPPTQTTQAPPPAKPAGSSAKVEKSLDEMSAEEYAKKRGYIK